MKDKRIVVALGRNAFGETFPEQKKNVKKPAGSAPGFVVYYTNYSLTIHPDISGLTLVESSNT